MKLTKLLITGTIALSGLLFAVPVQAHDKKHDKKCHDDGPSYSPGGSYYSPSSAPAGWFDQHRCNDQGSYDRGVSYYSPNSAPPGWWDNHRYYDRYDRYDQR